jgi:hypothetical protein
MFRYSLDELIASKQKEDAAKLLTGMGQKCQLQHSPEIEDLLQECRVDSYWYLEGVHQLASDRKEEIVITTIFRDNNSIEQVQWDLKRGFDKLDKSWKEPLPYVECSFPESYVSPHGAKSCNVFILFFTKYHDYEGSRDCIIHYLRKFYNLRAFI